MNQFKKYIFLFFKGIAMGAADVVPGVSGGTIAFIAGIYDELLASISSIKPSLINVLRKEGLAAVWQKVNGNFLLALLSGIAISILSLAKLIAYLLHHHPILLWSFFFGLILASIIYIGKQIKHWNIDSILGLLAGALFVYYLASMPPLSPNTSYLFLFFAGMLAACAMILPGISGSFILLILGVYSTIIQAISQKDLLKIVSVGLGAVTGLLIFSNLLKWLLSKYHNTMMSVLTGFLIGSLWKIWPWKTDESVYVKEIGVKTMEQITTDYASLSAYLKTLDTQKAEQFKAFVEHNVLPNTYEALNTQTSSQIIPAIVVCIIGFGVLFLIEFIAKKKNVNG